MPPCTYDPTYRQRHHTPDTYIGAAPMDAMHYAMLLINKGFFSRAAALAPGSLTLRIRGWCRPGEGTYDSSLIISDPD